jgi:UDP-N-acetylglucosamine 3-dehydrogenase
MKRIGIIGTGAIARHHALQWQKLPVELTGYYDLQPDAAATFAQQFGGIAFPTVEDLLANIDVVDICSPAGAHRQNVIAAVTAGVPIICEKPLARTLADCDAMLKAATATSVPLFIAHVVRFFPQFAAAKAALDSGIIGKPGVIRTVRSGSFPTHGRTFSSAFYADYNLSGGVILDLAIHDIDYHRWCMGEVTRVFAQGLTFRDEGTRDHALITLRFASGAVGHIEAGWANPTGTGFTTSLEIAGDEGLIEWDSRSKPPISWALSSPNHVDQVVQSSASPLAPEDDPYYIELAHFLDCIESGARARVTAEDAYQAVKISLAAIESVRTGQPIDLATFKEPSL